MDHAHKTEFWYLLGGSFHDFRQTLYMGDPLLHIKPMAEGDCLKERFKHQRKAAKSQSNTTHQSINDFIRFTKNNTQTAVMNITDIRIVRKK